MTVAAVDKAVPTSASTNSGLRVHLIFPLLVLAGCIWILSLPVFPSQDGPAHLYFAEVSARLFSGSDFFAQNFQIAHRLPPYAVLYYLLMMLLRWFSPVMAEKIVVALCFAVPAVGFLRFARSLGPAGGIVSLAALPLFLHRYLFLGFYNYSLALGLMWFAMAVWSGVGRSRGRQRVIFLLLVAATTLAHAVTLLLLLGFCWTQLLLSAWLNRRSATHELSGVRTGDWVTLLCASSSLLYVAHYVDRAAALSGNAAVPGSQFGFYGHRLLEVLQMYLVAPVIGVEYCLLLLLVVIVALAVALRATVKDVAARQVNNSQVSLGWGLLLLAGLAFLPTWMNHAALFAERLAVPCVLLIAAAAARAVPAGKTRVFTLAAAAVCVAAMGMLGPAINSVSRYVEVPVREMLPPRQPVLLANALNTPVGLTFDPCRHAGVRLIQQSNGLWLNVGLLDSDYMMLRPKHDAPEFESLLQQRPDAAVVVTHCGGDDHGLTGKIMAQYPNRWKLQRGKWANVLGPVSRSAFRVSR